MEVEIRPFRVRVDDSVLADLDARLARARFVRSDDTFLLSELAAYWRNRFDWRAQEHRINQLPQFMAGELHLVHARGRGSAPFPLLMTHGWPSAYTEMVKILPLLTDPAAHGGDPADAFDVVVPSVPGSIFSPPGPVTRLAAVMSALGYERFGAYGDLAPQLAAMHPAQVAGLHLTDPRRPTAAVTDRRDTLAAALIDSPAGLAAWIIDELRSRSDCGGDVRTRWTRDELLTLITLYWTTASIGTSMPAAETDCPRPVCTTPVGFTLSATGPEHARKLAERWYSDIRFWHEPKRGGQFMAHEEPSQLAEDLRTFFRPLRSAPAR